MFPIKSSSCCTVGICRQCQLWEDLAWLQREPEIPKLLKLLEQNCPHLVMHVVSENFKWDKWYRCSNHKRQAIAEYIAALAICGSDICTEYALSYFGFSELLDKIGGQTSWWIAANAKNFAGGPILSQWELRKLLSLGILPTPQPQECSFKWVNPDDDHVGFQVRQKPVHENIVLLAKNARGCWRPCRHSLFHHGFRSMVGLVMLIRARLDSERSEVLEPGEDLRVPTMPVELWFAIIGMIDRDSDFKSFGYGGVIGPYLTAVSAFTRHRY